MGENKSTYTWGWVCRRAIAPWAVNIQGLGRLHVGQAHHLSKEPKDISLSKAVTEETPNTQPGNGTQLICICKHDMYMYMYMYVVCIYIWYVCMYVRTYVGMYVCIYIHCQQSPGPRNLNSKKKCVFPICYISPGVTENAHASLKSILTLKVWSCGATHGWLGWLHRRSFRLFGISEWIFNCHLLCPQLQKLLDPLKVVWFNTWALQIGNAGQASCMPDAQAQKRQWKPC